VDALARDVERVGDVIAREPGVDDHDVARTRRVRVLRTVHPLRAGRHPLGMVQRDEVVDHRRPDACALRRVHPVAEVQDIEAAHETLCHRTAQPAPRRADRVGRGQDRQLVLDRDSGE
jgi:hypothetical protein